MKKIVLALLLTIGVMAGENIEKKPYYGGIAFTMNQTTGEHGSTGFLSHRSKEFTNSGLELTAGYKMYDFTEKLKLDAEVKLGTSFWMEDSENISTRNAGVFIKPTYYIGQALSVYALLGIADIEWSGRNDTVNSTGLAGGFGLSLMKKNGIGVYAEFITYPTEIYIPHIDDDATLQVLSGGIKYEW